MTPWNLTTQHAFQLLSRYFRKRLRQWSRQRVPKRFGMRLSALDVEGRGAVLMMPRAMMDRAVDFLFITQIEELSL